MENSKYKKGDKVIVYRPGQLIVREINEAQRVGATWVYSLLNPDTQEVDRVSFGGGGSKVDWQEERWLHPYRAR